MTLPGVKVMTCLRSKVRYLVRREPANVKELQLKPCVLKIISRSVSTVWGPNAAALFYPGQSIIVLWLTLVVPGVFTKETLNGGLFNASHSIWKHFKRRKTKLSKIKDGVLNLVEMCLFIGFKLVYELSSYSALMGLQYHFLIKNDEIIRYFLGISVQSLIWNYNLPAY